MLNGTGRGFVTQSSHITNRQLIPNWGITCNMRYAISPSEIAQKPSGNNAKAI